MSNQDIPQVILDKKEEMAKEKKLPRCGGCGEVLTMAVHISDDASYEGYVCPNGCDLEEVGLKEE